MAKLTNVKYPNEVVEIEGVQYRKVDREAKAGDIVKVLVDDYIDVEKGAFYSVITEDGATGFFDDDGDFREGDTEDNPEDFEVYEKVTEPAPPEYREVKREAKVGERIRIVAATLAFGTYENGDEFTVTSVYGDAGVKIDRKWRTSPERDAWVRHDEYVVLEPVNYGEPAPQPNRRLTVGDYAKVIANEGGHKYDIGSVVKIVIDDRDGRPYKGERADGTVGNWLAEREVIPATESEFNAQKRLNVGEYAKVVDASGCGLAKVGDIIAVTRAGHLIDGNTFDGRFISMFDHRFVRATESEVEAAKKAAERVKQIGEFADGGYAEIVNIEEEAKWSAIGRKVNEFKRGDIIEATRRLGEQERIYGEYTGERDEVALGVMDASRNYRSVSAHSAKLLIPVEQRFDLAEGGADLSK